MFGIQGYDFICKHRQLMKRGGVTYKIISEGRTLK